MDSSAESHLLLPTGQHTQTMIFLHGRDSTASEFASEIFESQASDDKTLPEIFPNMKWVFPNAPEILSERFDTKMSQWFDMWETENPHEREDQQQLETQIDHVCKIIAEEMEIVGAENLFIAGISQGCAIGIHALLAQKCSLAGFIGLSSWMPKYDELRAKASMDAVSTPVFLGHCEDDSVIAIKYGEELRDSLESLGMEVAWRAYEEGGHWLNEPQGVDDMVKFVSERIQG